jgi:hypothetical protein
MDQSKIDVRCGSLFPWHFQLIAVLILIAGVMLAIERPLIGIILAVAAGFILTASTGTEVDKVKNKYREYTSFYFFLKSGKYLKYPGAEKIFINCAKTTTRAYTAHTNHSAVFTGDEYNGYLKLVDGTKIHLLNSTKKEKLTTTLGKVASFLNVPLQDNTVV